MRLITLTLAVVSILVFAALARHLHQTETDRIQSDFTAEVAQQALSFEREVLLNLEILVAINAAVPVMDEPGPEQFEKLTRNILKRSPAIQAFAWAEIVTPETLAAFEARLDNWYPGYRVTERNGEGEAVPVSLRPRYVPVVMIEPVATNQAALGFDLASEPRRLSALLQALETDRLVATAGIRLVQEPDNQRGFLVFSSQTLPAKAGGALTGEERTVFVNGVFRVGELVNQSIGSVINHQMQVQVIDRTRDANDVLYSRAPEAGGPWLTERTVVHALSDVAGRQWSYEVTPAESLFTSRRSLFPWLVFGSGFVVVVLLVTYVLVTQRQTQALNKAKAQLEQISLTDSLTGLANRRHFDQHLEQQWAQAVREQKSISLVMIDIDNFKPYNDEYGHPQGDDALQQVAEALRTVATRPLDLVARYGGEEFALILPDTDDPVEIAHACRQAVAALALRHEHSDVASVVTISAGVCTLTPSDGYRQDQLTEWADDALYQAKEEGRNRVVVYAAESGMHRPG